MTFSFVYVFIVNKSIKITVTKNLLHLVKLKINLRFWNFCPAVANGNSTSHSSVNFSVESERSRSPTQQYFPAKFRYSRPSGILIFVSAVDDAVLQSEANRT